MPTGQTAFLAAFQKLDFSRASELLQAKHMPKRKKEEDDDEGGDREVVKHQKHNVRFSPSVNLDYSISNS